MRSSWKTTLFGLILGATAVLGQYGVKLGKVGNGDYLGLVQAIAAMGLGASARDNKVTSEQAGAK